MRPFPDKASRINNLESLRHGNNTTCNIVWLQALSRRIVECCSRSRNQGQGQVIRFHRYFWIWLLVLALDTCFWHNSLHNSTGAETGIFHDDVITMETFPRYCPFMREIHWSLVNPPSRKPVTWSFDVFFDLRLNKRLHKQSRHRWFEMPSPSLWRHCNVM